MSTPEPPSNAGPAVPPAPAATPAATGAPAAADVKPAKPAGPLPGHAPRAPLPPLEGWRGALEHTGLPRSWLNAKPRMPSRNWCIFLTVVGTISYMYYDDRRQCKQIRQEYIDKVEYLSKQQMSGSLDIPRKVTVYGARWPEDDESDRALRHFRKYVKPYLVAAAIDYDQVHAPLYGSISRIVHANTLRKRRQALGLEAPDELISLPGQLDPATAAQRELEGGTILVGRPALKEYLSGLRAGWSGGVGEWSWEKDVTEDIKNDGVFDEPVMEAEQAPAAAAAAADVAAPAPSTTAPSHTNLSFLARPLPSAVPPQQGGQQQPIAIPEHLHAAPAQLPAQPPILLVPFVNHLGFKQIPHMIYDFFTERKRVKAGAEAAYALIMSQTRPMDEADSNFGIEAEQYYKKQYNQVPERNKKAQDEYYTELAKRIESARQFARGERDLTDDEKKSDKPIVTEEDLRAERLKRELRWHGGLEGWNIVKPATPVAWQPEWDGWLRVFEQPSEVPEIDD